MKAPAAPPRVCLVVHGAGWAGTERHVRSLVEQLPGRGFDVRLITSEDGPLREHAQSLGVETVLVPRRSSLGYALSLLRVFHGLDPDVVHAHSGRLPAWVARLARVSRIVETRHGLLERLRPALAEFGWRWWLEALKCRAAHVTVTVAEADRAWLVRSGLDPERVRTVYNALPPLAGPGPDASSVSSRERPPDERRRTLGLVGRLDVQKAPERALELLALLKANSRFEYELIAIGDGPLRPELEQRAAKLGVAEDVTFRGRVPNASQVFGELDWLLLPSRAEGIPYVLLEALQVGLPVRTTPVGGVAEVLTDPLLRDAILPWSADAWARSIESADADPEYRCRWREASMARSEAFREEAMIANLARIYRDG